MMDPNFKIPEMPPVRVPRSIPPDRPSVAPSAATIWDKTWAQVLYGVVMLLVLLALDVTLAFVE